MTVEHQIRSWVKWRGVDSLVRPTYWSDARMAWFHSSRELRGMQQMVDNPISEEMMMRLDAPIN